MYKLYSWLFGSALLHHKGYEKAIKYKADVYVIDLEDSVHPANKQLARENLKEILQYECHDTSLPIKAVRINSIRSIDGVLDLSSLFKCNNKPQIIILSKVNFGVEIKIVKSVLSELIGPKTYIFSIIESAAAAVNLYDIANESDGLFFGAADYSADLGNDITFESNLYIRQKIVLAAAYNKIPAIDTNCFDFKNTNAIKSECELSKKMGFSGKAAIHPNQINIINDVFGYTSAEIQKTKNIIQEYNKNNKGFSITGGKIIAPPFVKRAEALLKRVKNEKYL